MELYEDLKMSPPMLKLEEDLPEYAKGWQQDFMDLYKTIPNELDPQLAFIVRNLAYQRALMVKQDEFINAQAEVINSLVAAVNDLMTYVLPVED